MILRVLGFAYFAAGCLYAWKRSPAISPAYWVTTVRSLRAQRLPVLLAPLFIVFDLAVDLVLWPYEWWRWRRLMKRMNLR